MAIQKYIYKHLFKVFKDTTVVELSQNHKKSIEIGKQQIERGKYITNEELNSLLKEFNN